MANRKSRPIVLLTKVTIDYIGWYVLRITERGVQPYEVKTLNRQDIIKFLEVMRNGIYAVRVATGMTDTDREFEAQLIARDIRIIED